MHIPILAAQSSTVIRPKNIQIQVLAMSGPISTLVNKLYSTPTVCAFISIALLEAIVVTILQG
jgi:hypothetical protein